MMLDHITGANFIAINFHRLYPIPFLQKELSCYPFQRDYVSSLQREKLKKYRQKELLCILAFQFFARP
ncbi:hypothetical protein RM11_1095 [Bartonella quintana RM-11]|nr:hypothetical protein RM11_1095 [Bartonella quintana RM-11]